MKTGKGVFRQNWGKFNRFDLYITVLYNYNCIFCVCFYCTCGCFVAHEECWVCIYALCLSSFLGAIQYNHSLLLLTTEQSQQASWGLRPLFTTLTIVEVDDSGCHPTHTDFPRLSGDLNHIRSKLMTLQSQVWFVFRDQFASSFCSDHVDVCYCLL